MALTLNVRGEPSGALERLTSVRSAQTMHAPGVLAATRVRSALSPFAGTLE
jgi:hypothetical protein